MRLGVFKFHAWFNVLLLVLQFTTLPPTHNKSSRSNHMALSGFSSCTFTSTCWLATAIKHSRRNHAWLRQFCACALRLSFLACFTWTNQPSLHRSCGRQLLFVVVATIRAATTLVVSSSSYKTYILDHCWFIPLELYFTLASSSALRYYARNHNHSRYGHRSVLFYGRC